MMIPGSMPFSAEGWADVESAVLAVPRLALTKGLEPQSSVSGVFHALLLGVWATPLPSGCICTFPHAFLFLASSRHEETSLGASICLSSQVRSK